MKKIGLFFGTALLCLCATTAKAETYYAYLSSAQEVPANASTATGYARVVLNESALTVTWSVVFTGLSSNQSASHIHGPSAVGANSGVLINFPAVGGTAGTLTGTAAITAGQITNLRAGLTYVNIHSANFPGGEIRGQLGKKRPVDFDGDGRQDFSVLRFPSGSPQPITLWSQNSTSGTQVVSNFGNAATDFPVPGDYDGDGRDDLALYRRGAASGDQSFFFILRSSNSVVQTIPFGLFGDTAIDRDYDGDGVTDIAIYRGATASGSQSNWWIRRSTVGLTTTGNDLVVPFGTAGATPASMFDVPIPGDYDGDGRFDIAVYRTGFAPDNTYIVRRSSDNVVTFTNFGNFQTDYVVPGDYDGDGKFDLAVARTGAVSTSPLVWWIQNSSNGALRVQTFGITSDNPVQGDYDGDAKTDIAIYRAGTTAGAQSFFWVFNSFTNTAQPTPWGIRTSTAPSIADFPIATFDAR